MSTVPAHSLLAPVLAAEIAALRVIPGVCGVFESSSSPRTTRTPRRRQSGLSSTVPIGPRESNVVAGRIGRWYGQAAGEPVDLAGPVRFLPGLAGRQRAVDRLRVRA